MNAFAHCYGCHQKYGSNPDYFVRHYIDTYGEGALELIREKAEDINLGKRMNKEQKLIAKHYKTEAARMENERASGVVGWLEFVSWDQSSVNSRSPAVIRMILSMLASPGT